MKKGISKGMISGWLAGFSCGVLEHSWAQLQPGACGGDGSEHTWTAGLTEAEQEVSAQTVSQEVLAWRGEILWDSRRS